MIMISSVEELRTLIRNIARNYRIEDGWINLYQKKQDGNVNSLVRSYIKKFRDYENEQPSSDISDYNYPEIPVKDDKAKVLVVEVEDLRDGSLLPELNQSIKIKMGLVEEKKSDNEIIYKKVNSDKSTEQSLIKLNNSFSARWSDINNILEDDEAIFLVFSIQFICTPSLINQLDNNPRKIVKLHNNPRKIVKLPISNIIYVRETLREQLYVSIFGKKIIKKKIIDNPIKYLFSIGYKPDGSVEYFEVFRDVMSNEHQISLVYFDRRVLSKYEQSQYFIVESMSLQCRGSQGWHLQIQNNKSHIISVFLPHIIEQLPEAEYKHWMAYNLAPPPSDIELTRGETLTATGGSPHSPDRRDHVFKDLIREYWRQCQDQGIAPIFKELNQIDQPYFNTLNLICENSQWNFDVQILCISKIIIESVDKDILINRGILGDGTKNMLKSYLEQNNQNINYFNYKNFLDNLYKIRLGSAHRRSSKKDSDYYKGIRFFKNKYGENLVDILDGIFDESRQLLQLIINIEIR